jgi:MFS family permease
MSTTVPVLGLLIGGFITDNYGWQWIFLSTYPSELWPPLIAIPLPSVPPDKTNSAASFFNFFRMLSTGVGIAFGITIWQTRTAFHRQHLVEELNPWQPGKESQHFNLFRTWPAAAVSRQCGLLGRN